MIVLPAAQVLRRSSEGLPSRAAGKASGTINGACCAVVVCLLFDVLFFSALAIGEEHPNDVKDSSPITRSAVRYQIFTNAQSFSFLPCRMQVIPGKEPFVPSVPPQDPVGGTEGSFCKDKDGTILVHRHAPVCSTYADVCYKQAADGGNAEEGS
jgi:hypothetical protein